MNQPTPNAGPAKVIEVVIQPDGQTTITTKGFLGSACQQASQFLRRALGIAASEQLTQEYYQDQSAQSTARLVQDDKSLFT